MDYYKILTLFIVLNLGMGMLGIFQTPNNTIETYLGTNNAGEQVSNDYTQVGQEIVETDKADWTGRISEDQTDQGTGDFSVTGMLGTGWRFVSLTVRGIWTSYTNFLTPTGISLLNMAGFLAGLFCIIINGWWILETIKYIRGTN